jgi:ABC transporter transmembrane region 2
VETAGTAAPTRRILGSGGAYVPRRRASHALAPRCLNGPVFPRSARWFLEQQSTEPPLGEPQQEPTRQPQQQHRFPCCQHALRPSHRDHGRDGCARNHDAAAVLFLSLIYFPLLAASVGSTVVQVYVRMTLQRRWRAWLNDQLVDRWLANGRYYLLNLVSGDHKNPEFRIAEDVRVATEAPVEFATGVTAAFLSAATFVAVLWTIGGTLDVHVAAYTSSYRDSWWSPRCSTRCRCGS